VPLSVRRASNVEALHALLRDCGTDLEKRLGLSHWLPTYPLELFRQQADAGNVREVVGSDGRVVATFTLSSQAPPYYHDVAWAPEGDPGVYVTRLAVRPSRQGSGVGTWCMAWIEAEAARRGAGSVRLDAYTGHASLLRFYRGLGYAERGTLVVNDRPLTCFEKLVGPAG
jgi:GNAT superfamily N-acetyltransferase